VANQVSKASTTPLCPDVPSAFLFAPPASPICLRLTLRHDLLHRWLFKSSTDDGRASRSLPRAPCDAALLLPAAASPPPPFISRAQPLIKSPSCILHSYKVVVSLDLLPYTLLRCSLYLNIGFGIPGDLIFIFLLGTRI
jgi:hypothetical protein